MLRSTYIPDVSKLGIEPCKSIHKLHLNLSVY